MNLGLSINIGGRSAGRLPTDGTPTLILDFVPTADPTYGAALSLNFSSEQYRANAADPLSSGIINLQVWN